MIFFFLTVIHISMCIGVVKLTESAGHERNDLCSIKTQVCVCAVLL